MRRTARDGHTGRVASADVSVETGLGDTVPDTSPISARSDARRDTRREGCEEPGSGSCPGEALVPSPADRAATVPDRDTTNGKRGETAVVGPPPDPEGEGGHTGPDPPLRTLRGEFTLTHADIALTQATAAVPGVTVRPEQVVADGAETVLVFTVQGDELDTFEQALESSERVLELLLLSDDADGRCYRATLGGEVLAVSTILTRIGVRLLDVVGSEGEWNVRAQFRSRELFLQLRDYCGAHDIAFRLRRLSRDDGEADWRLSGLTPEQWDTLRQAHEAGYFNVPREITQSELADRLGVSPSAVSQRLRRAMSQLIDAQLPTDDS